MGKGEYMKTLILIGMLLMLPAIAFAQEKPKEKFQAEYSAIYNQRQIVTISGITDETEKMLVWLTVGAMPYMLDGSIPKLTDGVPYLGIHQVIMLTREEGLKFIGIASMNGTKFHCLQFRK